MPRLGEILRARREKKGITLDQAAADTRIREKFLTALEDGDVQSLPGAVYTRGFLRNYAAYLDLDEEELVVLYHQERGMTPEPAPQKRRFKEMKPIGGRSLVFTPVVFVPVAVLSLVVLFIGYLYYQFTSFAVAPALDVTDPATDAIAQSTSFVVHGKTVPAGRVTIQVFPGPLTVADIKPEADGTFSAPVTLTTGSNHIVVEVLDPSGKVSRVNRSVILQPETAAATPGVAVTLDEPSNGQRYENVPVTIVGRTEPTITSVVINGATVPVQSGHFEARFYFPAGPTEITVIAGTSSGPNTTLKRQVNVVYTSAVVQVFVRGGDAWMHATVDGNVVAGTGRVYKDGETATFTGRTVVVRSGNAAATALTYNGVYQGTMGQQGQIAEKTYTGQ